VTRFSTTSRPSSRVSDRARGRRRHRSGRQSRRTGIGDRTPDLARDSASAGAESGESSPEYSETNIQEADVDEPDIVKTDGSRIVAVARARVHMIDSAGGKLSLRKTLGGTAARNVFLSGDRLLVFSDQAAQSSEPGSPWAGPMLS
jgi:hypothetical protein